MTTPATVYACVLSRAGYLHRRTRVALEAAIRRAESAGVRCLSAEGGSPYGVALARNAVVAQFLTSKCSHLLMVDDDVVVPPEAITRLVAVGGDITLGCYGSVKTFGDGTTGFYVVVLRLGGGAEDVYRSWPAGVEEVAGGGAGCMLVARPVLELVPYPWFRFQGLHVPGTGNIVTVGEDVDFCQRARAAGFRVWADGGVRCGHYKEIDVSTLVKESQ